MTTDCPFGYRVVGGLSGRRRLVVAGRALAGYCACDPAAQVEREAYLSAFAFPDAFRGWMEANGSPKGYSGACGSSWLWFDVDSRGDLGEALQGTRRLVGSMLGRYRSLDEDGLLIFFSGAKGFHVGLPLAWRPAASTTFNVAALCIAQGLAERAGVGIDVGVYDRVRAFRAPNSRHPKTGLHKCRLAHDELMGLSAEGIRALARQPLPFDLPPAGDADPVASEDWARAEAEARRQAGGTAQVRARPEGNGPTLNRGTLDFIRDGAAVGDRHRLLFSAAANLAEFGCPPALAHALLSGSARDSGLPPSEVRRQIDCGLRHAGGATTATGHLSEEPS